MSERPTQIPADEEIERFVDRELAKRAPGESDARAEVLTNKLVKIFRERDVPRGEERVKKWVMVQYAGDTETQASLFKQLHDYAVELLGDENSPNHAPNNFSWLMPTGSRGNRVRRSGWSRQMVARGTGKTLDSSLATGDQHESDRHKNATIRSLTADIEEGLEALNLNKRLNQLHQANRTSRIGLPSNAYNEITIPLLLYLRLKYGYNEDELTR